MRTYRRLRTLLLLGAQLCVVVLLTACNPIELRKPREPDPGPPPQVNVPAGAEETTTPAEKKPQR